MQIRANSQKQAHPRVSGENKCPARAKEIKNGSSPRERGKLVIAFLMLFQARLIPA